MVARLVPSCLLALRRHRVLATDICLSRSPVQSVQSPGPGEPPGRRTGRHGRARCPNAAPGDATPKHARADPVALQWLLTALQGSVGQSASAWRKRVHRVAGTRAGRQGSRGCQLSNEGRTASAVIAHLAQIASVPPRAFQGSWALRGAGQQRGDALEDRWPSHCCRVYRSTPASSRCVAEAWRSA
jgi:hypothetical protein